MEFEFERRRVTKEEIRELIFREILEYHPQLLKDYMDEEMKNLLGFLGGSGATWPRDPQIHILF